MLDLELNKGLTDQELRDFIKKESYYDLSLNKYPSFRDYSLLKNEEYLMYQEDVNPYKLKTYSNISFLKEATFNEEMTEWEISEYIKCASHFWYFVENYVKINTLDEGIVLIKPFDYQKDIVNGIIKNTNVIIMLGRQQGKTSTNCLYILWYILFHKSVKVYLFGSTYTVAKENIKKIYEMLSELPFFLNPGFLKKNESSFVLGNRSLVEARPSSPASSRGITPNVVLWDESAHTDGDEDFYAAISQTISSSTKNKAKMILVSTPKGLSNVYARIWHEAVSKKNIYVPIFKKWSDNPIKDQKWLSKQKGTMSDLKFRQEVLCDFLGSSNTLIDGNTLSKMSEDIIDPIYQTETYKKYEKPSKKKNYIITVDVAEGVGLDYSVVNVFDVTTRPFKQVAIFRDNKITPHSLATLTLQIAQEYNDAQVLVENNSKGSITCKIIYDDYNYNNFFCEDYSNEMKYGLRMTHASKSKGCVFLKELLETCNLVIRDRETYEEITRFEKQDKTFKGAKNTHDDIVMTLVSFAWYSDHHEFGVISNIDLKKEILDNRLRNISEDRLPMPIRSDFLDRNLHSKSDFDFYDYINPRRDEIDENNNYFFNYENFMKTNY